MVTWLQEDQCPVSSELPGLSAALGPSQLASSQPKIGGHDKVAPLLSVEE